jgi:hypothetical protein
MFDFLNAIPHATTVMTGIGLLISVLAFVSPLTRSDIDNKVLDFLRKVVALGGSVVGHKDRPADSVRDHRNGTK